jgi:hypothetical protein
LNKKGTGLMRFESRWGFVYMIGHRWLDVLIIKLVKERVRARGALFKYNIWISLLV